MRWLWQELLAAPLDVARIISGDWIAVVRITSGAWDGFVNFTSSWLWLELLKVAGMAVVPGIISSAWDGCGKVY